MYGRKEQKLRQKYRRVFGCFPYKKKEKTEIILLKIYITKNIQNDQHKNRKQGILDKCEQEYEKMCVEIVRKGCYDSTVKKVRT